MPPKMNFDQMAAERILSGCRNLQLKCVPIAPDLRSSARAGVRSTKRLEIPELKMQERDTANSEPYRARACNDSALENNPPDSSAANMRFSGWTAFNVCLLLYPHPRSGIGHVVRAERLGCFLKQR